MQKQNLPMAVAKERTDLPWKLYYARTPQEVPQAQSAILTPEKRAQVVDRYWSRQGYPLSTMQGLYLQKFGSQMPQGAIDAEFERIRQEVGDVGVRGLAKNPDSVSRAREIIDYLEHGEDDRFRGFNLETIQAARSSGLLAKLEDALSDMPPPVLGEMRYYVLPHFVSGMGLVTTPEQYNFLEGTERMVREFPNGTRGMYHRLFEGIHLLANNIKDHEAFRLELEKMVQQWKAQLQPLPAKKS